MKQWRLAIGVLVFITCIAGFYAPILAADLYVSTRGKDSNPGTKGKPFRTMTAATSHAVSGDRIFVAAGTYQETGLVVTDLSLSGGWDNRFVSCNPWQDRTIVDAGGAQYSQGIAVYGSATIQGIKIIGAQDAGIVTMGSSLNLYDCEIDGAVRGIKCHNCNYKHFDIQRCLFRNQTLASVELYGANVQGPWIVANNRFEYTPGTGAPSGGAVYKIGPPGSCLAPDIMVLNNTFSGASFGVNVYSEVNSLDVSRNIFYNVGSPITGATASDQNCFEESSPQGTNYIYPSCGVDYVTWHLVAGSPCIDISTCLFGTLLDFEGDSRPANNTCDVGADEYRP